MNHVHSHPPEAAVWLKRLLVQLATRAEQDVQRVPLHPETAIHSLRKRMKKLLALLRLARPALSVEQFANLKTAIRDLKRAVATQRDAHVMTRLAEDFGDPSGSTGSASSPRKPSRRKSAQAEISNATMDHMARLGARLTDRLGRLRLYSLGWESLAAAYAKTYRKGRKSLAKSEKTHATDDLHAWRKAVKDHYYQMLALYPWLGHPRRLRRTRRLASLLGKVHDIDVFLAQGEAAEETHAALAAKRKKVLDKIWKKSARVYAKSVKDLLAQATSLLPE
jgi:CHAD domain-containing protein